MLNPALSRPSAAPASLSRIEISLEQLVGDIVAGVCSLIVQGMLETRQDGRMGPATKADGGVLMAGLVELQQAYADVLDFDRLCHQAGVRTLRERSGTDVSDALIDKLVGEAVDIMRGIVRLRSN